MLSFIPPTHKFQELGADKRPQDPHLDGTGLRFENRLELAAEGTITFPDC
jgi:hypothetical protein